MSGQPVFDCSPLALLQVAVTRLLKLEKSLLMLALHTLDGSILIVLDVAGDVGALLFKDSNLPQRCLNLALYAHSIGRLGRLTELLGLGIQLLVKLAELNINIGLLESLKL